MYTRSVRHSFLPRLNRIDEFRIFLPSSFKKNKRGLRGFFASSTQDTSISVEKKITRKNMVKICKNSDFFELNQRNLHGKSNVQFLFSHSPICGGRLIPLYFKHELTVVQVTCLRSRIVVHFLSSRLTSFESISNVVVASTTATGRDLIERDKKKH